MTGPWFPSSEQVAQRFHEVYERLAPEFGYETRPESAVAWDDVPEANRKLMIATCEVMLGELREYAIREATNSQEVPRA